MRSIAIATDDSVVDDGVIAGYFPRNNWQDDKMILLENALERFEVFVYRVFGRVILNAFLRRISTSIGTQG
jgi:hypothetical protein